MRCLFWFIKSNCGVLMKTKVLFDIFHEKNSFSSNGQSKVWKHFENQDIIYFFNRKNKENKFFFFLHKKIGWSFPHKISIFFFTIQFLKRKKRIKKNFFLGTGWLKTVSFSRFHSQRSERIFLRERNHKRISHVFFLLQKSFYLNNLTTFSENIIGINE